VRFSFFYSNFNHFPYFFDHFSIKTPQFPSFFNYFSIKIPQFSSFFDHFSIKIPQNPSFSDNFFFFFSQTPPKPPQNPSIFPIFLPFLYQNRRILPLSLLGIASNCPIIRSFRVFSARGTWTICNHRPKTCMFSRKIRPRLLEFRSLLRR
jgi:hypothetical protein